MLYAKRKPEYEKPAKVGSIVVCAIGDDEEVIGKIVSMREKTFSIELSYGRTMSRPYSKLLKVLNEDVMDLSDEELEDFCENPDFDYWNYNLKIWHLGILIEKNPDFKYWEYELDHHYIWRLCRFNPTFKYWDYELTEGDVRTLELCNKDFDIERVKYVSGRKA